MSSVSCDLSDLSVSAIYPVSSRYRAEFFAGGKIYEAYLSFLRGEIVIIKNFPSLNEKAMRVIVAHRRRPDISFCDQRAYSDGRRADNLDFAAVPEIVRYLVHVHLYAVGFFDLLANISADQVRIVPCFV